MPEIQVLLIGDVDRAEFRESAACLEREAAVKTAVGVEAAQAALAAGFSPDVIVAAQAYPGQYSHEDINRLRRAAPLARIVGLMGSWCEGEQRSGRPWPSSARLYWHQWPARCRRQFRRLARGERCSFALPPTAAEEERLLADLGQGSGVRGQGAGVRGQRSEVRGQGSGVRGQGSGVRGQRSEDGGHGIDRLAAASTRREHSSENLQISKSPNLQIFSGLTVIRCRSFETWDWLRVECRRMRLAAVWQRGEDAVRAKGVTAAIFDCDELDEKELDGLRVFAAAFRPAPVVVLTSFPRIEDHGRALAAGAAAVLSKPLLLDDLFLELCDNNSKVV